MEMVIEKRLRRDIYISDNQFHFMGGRLTIEVLHLIRGLMEFYRDKKKDLHKVFTDFEKAYDRTPGDVLWSCLEKKYVANEYTQAIKGIYKRTKEKVRILGGDTKDFCVDIGLYQRSALSPVFS